MSGSKGLLPVFVIAAALGAKSLPQQSDFPVLVGPYFGQEPPGLTPEVFAPGIVTTNLHDDGSPIFTPDGREVYFKIISGYAPDYVVNLFVMRQDGSGKWSEPELSSLTEDFGITNGAFSPDGQRFFFTADRHAKDPVNPGLSAIRSTTRNQGGWDEPMPVGTKVDTPGQEMFVQASGDGTLYFQVKDHPEDPNDIYVSEFQGGRHLEPRALGPPIGTAGWEQAPSPSPDGSYLVFTGRMRQDQADGLQRLYVTCRNTNGSWTEPRELELDYPGYHPGGRFSRISPDGKYLFFTKFADTEATGAAKSFSRKWDHELLKNNPAYEFNDADVFWVSTDIITPPGQSRCGHPWPSENESPG